MFKFLYMHGSELGNKSDQIIIETKLMHFFKGYGENLFL